jgi:hypothetical protein
MKNIVSGLIIFLSVFGQISAQECGQQDIHNQYCTPPGDASFKEYGVSRTIAVQCQSARKMVIPFFGDKKYYITFCTEGLSQENIHFRVLADEEHVIYDNKDDSFRNYFEFFSYTPCKLIFKISLPESQSGFGTEPVTCVGVMVYEKEIEF